MVNNLRKEHHFKLLLEHLFLTFDDYDNLITLVTNCTQNETDLLSLATDFAEELSLYKANIESIFNMDIFDIDEDTLNIQFNLSILQNIRLAIRAIKALTPRDFERLCAVYIEFLGTTGKPNITKDSHDQGIDFIGVIEKSEDSRLLHAHQNINKIYLVGQAKHYEKEKVSSYEIRELAGSIYLLRTKGFAVQNNPYVGVDLKSFTPIYPYFITSYYFSESAKRLCLNTDIIPVDRILLAITFGLNRRFHDDEEVFSASKLHEILAEMDYFN